MKRATILLSIMLALSMLLAACQPATPSPVTPSPVVPAPTNTIAPVVEETKEPTAVVLKKIVIGLSAGPLALDVYHDPATTSQTIAFNMLEPLVILSHDMSKVVYRLATSIESIDPLTWIIKLRENVKWQDGETFTSADVVFTFNMMKTESATLPHKYPVGIIYNVSAIDQYTVIIVTEVPYAVMVRRLVEFPMLPKHSVEAMGLDEFSKKPVGTGPYQFVDWVKDSHVTLKANQNWWGGKPMYDEVVFRIIPDASTRQADLMSGTIDLMMGLSPDLVPTIKAREELEVVSVPGLRCMSLIFNPHIKPLDDVLVRQAINYAIDKKQLMEFVLGGYAIPSYEQLSENDFGYTLEGINKYEYDPVKAKELLTQAGYPKGFTFDLQLGRRFSKDLELMTAIQSMLAEVGITMNIIPMEWGTFFSQYYNTGKMTSAYYGFANMIADGDLPLYNLYSSASKGKWYGGGSAEMDELIAAEQAELDPAKREGILNEIIREGNANVYQVDLFHYMDLWGQKKGLEWFPRSDTRVLLYTLD